MKSFELGYFGNIWVRQHILEEVGTGFEGHQHKFDHVTMLVSGKVLVQIEGKEPKEFTAPTFIVIRKEHKHRITALADNTVYYCVFALRNLDGEVMEIFGPEHDPESSDGRPEGYWEKVKQAESL